MAFPAQNAFAYGGVGIIQEPLVGGSGGRINSTRSVNINTPAALEENLTREVTCFILRNSRAPAIDSSVSCEVLIRFANKCVGTIVGNFTPAGGMQEYIYYALADTEAEAEAAATAMCNGDSRSSSCGTVSSACDITAPADLVACDSAGEIRSPENGLCDTCAANEKPNMEQNACVPQNCEAGEYRKADETCEACTAGTEPNTAGDACIAECQGDLVRTAGADTCMCPNNEIPNTRTADQNDCAAAAVCTGDMMQTADMLGCMCADDKIADNNNCVFNCAAAEQPAGSIPNAENDACVCPENTQLYSGVNVCAAALPASRYSAAHCTEGNWTITVLADSENRIRQNCIIPVEIEAADFIPASGKIAAAALKPQQTNVGDMPDECVLAEHSGFTFAGNNAPPCNAPNLFGNLGLPARPAQFNIATDRLIVAAGGNVYFNSQVINRIAAPGGGGGGGGGTGGANIASGGGGVGPGGIMIFALIGAVLLSGKDGLNPDAFAFTPHTSFSHNGGANYSYGSRLDYRQNEVSAYWGASQTGTNGGADSWRYTSGLKYAKDFWSAAFDGVNYEKATEIDMRFSAEFRSGIWHWQSGINADYDLDELGVGDGAAYWNTEAAVFYGGWEISPSVGLYWRDGEDFGEDARFRINLRREF